MKTISRVALVLALVIGGTSVSTFAQQEKPKKEKEKKEEKKKDEKKKEEKKDEKKKKKD